MTTIEVQDLYELVDAPASVPRRFGAFSVLEFGDEGDAADMGVTWESNACTIAGYTSNACIDPSVLPLVSAQCVPYGSANPFGVYVYNTDSVAGRPMAAHEAATRARLLAGEEAGVEAWLAAFLPTIDTPVAAFETSTGVSEAAVIALATVEGAEALNVNTERIIWVDTTTASILGSQGAIAREGSVMRTALGSRVAVIAPSLSGVIYASGPFKAHRSGVEFFSGADRAINNVSVIAQRVYVLGTACEVASTVIGYPV